MAAAAACWPSRSGEDADLARAEDLEVMLLATAGVPEPEEEEEEWGWSCVAVWAAVAAVDGMTWAVGMEVTLRTGWNGGLLLLLLLLQNSGGRKSTAAGSAASQGPQKSIYSISELTIRLMTERGQWSSRWK